MYGKQNAFRFSLSLNFSYHCCVYVSLPNYILSVFKYNIRNTNTSIKIPYRRDFGHFSFPRARNTEQILYLRKGRLQTWKNFYIITNVIIVGSSVIANRSG